MNLIFQVGYSPYLRPVLTALLIDDEARARRVMRALLTDYCEGVSVVGECADVPGAVKEIHRTRPDVVFCDIEMPGYSGLELLDFFAAPTFALVFATGYSEYAVRAFELSAVDYLLKPIQIAALERCLKKVRTQRATSAAQLRLLGQHLAPQPASRIALPVSEGLRFVDLATLILLEADGAYTKVYQSDGSRTIVSKKLRFFEEHLRHHPAFFRTHRSAMVHLDHLTRYVRADGEVHLSNGHTAPVARQKRSDFEARIAHLRL